MFSLTHSLIPSLSLSPLTLSLCLLPLSLSHTHTLIITPVSVSLFFSVLPITVTHSLCLTHGHALPPKLMNHFATGYVSAASIDGRTKQDPLLALSTSAVLNTVSGNCLVVADFDWRRRFHDRLRCVCRAIRQRWPLESLPHTAGTSSSAAAAEENSLAVHGYVRAWLTKLYSASSSMTELPTMAGALSAEVIIAHRLVFALLTRASQVAPRLVRFIDDVFPPPVLANTMPPYNKHFSLANPLTLLYMGEAAKPVRPESEQPVDRQHPAVDLSIRPLRRGTVDSDLTSIGQGSKALEPTTPAAYIVLSAAWMPPVDVAMKSENRCVQLSQFAFLCLWSADRRRVCVLCSESCSGSTGGGRAWPRVGRSLRIASVHCRDRDDRRFAIRTESAGA